MREATGVGAGLVASLLLAGAAGAQAPPGVGTDEFGLTPRQLVQKIEQVEAQIAKCMRSHGFQYIAVDNQTVRRGMSADKKMPGMSEEEFHEKYGFGISTMYTGQAPQLTTGYSPARVGLGEQNIQIYKSLSAADQVAYNRALFGENPEATFAVGLETEDFSRTGGCTRAAVGEIFEEEQLKASYYNPLDSLIRQDPRMKAAIREYSAEMRKAGFDYDHPDDVEGDIRDRLNALTSGGTIPLEDMSPDQRAALTELQDYERRVAVTHLELADRIFDPVEESIEKEMFARKVQ